jgi:RND family efflux transporter MFP subunit
MLASKVMGNVIEIRKRAGQSVRRGEVVIVIDSQDVSGQIAQAEGALAQARAAATLAETNLKRFEQLLSRGSASQLELDQARFQAETARGAVTQAEGAVATARSYSSYAEIPSPFSGRVVDRMCDVGDLAAPGRPLMKVEDATRLRLHASLDAEKAVAAVPGASVEVVVASLGERIFRGTVAEVVPAADPATRSVLVKVDIEADPALRAGVFGRVRFVSGTRQAIRVPRTALHTRGGLVGVFVVEAGRSAFRLVTTAEATGDFVEVLAGLEPGDQLIVSAPPGLEVDVPVEVQP